MTSAEPVPSLAVPDRHTGFRIRDLRTTVVNATPHTNWVMVHVDTEEGPSGIGEATLGGHEDLVIACVAQLAPRFAGQSAGAIEWLCTPVPGAPGGLAYAAALSAVEQALWDLLGQELGVPVHRLLGGPCRDRIRVYANINRGTQGSRSPTAFARSAEEAVTAGFTAVKCAPFDGLFRQSLEDRQGRELVEAGLARLRAVREGIGDDIDLLIECHGRFDARTAIRVINELEAYRPYWIEAPVSERDLVGWRSVRANTRARLAGAESRTGVEAHRYFLEASGADVVMPDVKYVGGIGPLKKVAALADAWGAEVSPHNPSGPVGTLSSLHATAAITNCPILEFPWGEVDWRSDLVGGAERLRGGCLLLPKGPGLGITFDTTLAAAHPRQTITPLADLRLW